MASNEFEKYEIIEIDREQIKNAPYNPRIISTEAKRKLKENIGRVGLLTPLVWNKRTGNMVSGHQRLASLDALHHTKTYRLRVAAVDLDEKTEHEQNMFFNNLSAQGQWDMEKLEVLLSEPIDVNGYPVLLDLDHIGFTTAEIYQNLGSRPLEARPETLEQIGEALRKNRELMAKLNRGLVARDMTREAYCVVVFKNYDGRVEFTGRLGLQDNRYVDGGWLMSKFFPDRDQPQISSTGPSPEPGEPGGDSPKSTPTDQAEKPKDKLPQHRKTGGGGH